MAWIESHQALKDHPKTRKLARLLDTSLAAAIGHLHLLWWWALDYAPEGNLRSFDGEEIASAALWEGNPEKFLSVMSTVGFIDYPEPDHPVIHDWMEYAGKLIDRRKANTERKRQARLADVPTPSASRPQDVLRTSESTVPTVPNSTGPTVPNLTVPIPPSGEEGSDAKKSEYPEWFNPLVGLEGFRKIAHEGSIKKIREGCEDAGVKTATVVSSFAEYYRDGGRSTHGWSDPVKALVRTLGVQISKVKGHEHGNIRTRIPEEPSPFAGYGRRSDEL